MDRTRYVAHTHTMIPLDDPLAIGCGGLEGFDESGELRAFPSRGLAVVWLGRRFEAHRPGSMLGWASDGWIDRERWDETYDAWFADYRWFYESPLMSTEPPAEKAVACGEEAVSA